MKKITTIILFLGLTLCSLAQNGAYTGKAEAIVGGAMGPFESKNTIEYTITQNTDNTINVAMSEAEYNVTLMGDIRLGEYIVSNIPYDSSKGAYFLDYASQNLNVDITLKDNKKNYIISIKDVIFCYHDWKEASGLWEMHDAQGTVYDGLKVMVGGQLYIIRNNRVYNVMGKEL